MKAVILVSLLCIKMVSNFQGLTIRTGNIKSLAAIVALFTASTAFALPINPTIVSGAATFTTTGANLIVESNADTILNWDSFDLAALETITFNQPNFVNQVINNVLGSSLNTIAGHISSNGNITFSANSFLVLSSAVISAPSITFTVLQNLTIESGAVVQTPDSLPIDSDTSPELGGHIIARPVPEPSTYALLIAGLIGIRAYLRRQSR